MAGTFLNVRTLVVEWGDCDPAGIVFYPRYFAMFDASSWALFAAALGCSGSELLQRYGIIGFPMVDIRAAFHAPVRFGDTIRITSHVGAIKRSSFTVLHELHRQDDTLAVTAWETRVWAAARPNDPGGIGGVTIPDIVRAALVDVPVDGAKP